MRSAGDRGGLRATRPVTVSAVVGGLILCLSSPSVVAETLVVGPGGFAEIQDAVDAAGTGDTILIMPGTYGVPSDGVDFTWKNLHVTSSCGAESTIIDLWLADQGFLLDTSQDTSSVIEGLTLDGTNAYSARGIRCENSSVQVRDCVFHETFNGVSVEGGEALLIGNCVFDGLGRGFEASAVSRVRVENSVFRNHRIWGFCLWDGSYALVRDCEFEPHPYGCAFRFDESDGDVEGCRVTGGEKGIVCDGGSSPDITGCTVEGCVNLWPHGDKHGAAVYCKEGSSPAFTECSFIDNQAEFGAGAYCTGGSAPVFEDCVFSGNSAQLWGGGICCVDDSDLTARDCVFEANESHRGGAILANECSPTIRGCTMVRNRSDDAGGVSCMNVAAPTVTQCIIAFSTAGNALASQHSSPEIRNCVVFANAGGDSLEGDYHDNLFADPRFCDLDAGDYTLCANSPCLAANSPWAVLVGALGGGCGDCDSLTAPSSWGAIKAMFR